MNSVNIMGRMVIEPECKATANQNKYCSFRIAVNAGKDKEPYFIPVMAWNKTAENIQKYFHKGDLIAISGILTSRSYEDKDNQKHTIIEVIANSFDFCNGRKSDQSQQETSQETPTGAGAEPTGNLPFEI